MAINGYTLVEQSRKQVSELTVQDLQQIMQRNPQAIVIDIREPDETVQGHIATALLIPRGVLEMKIDSVQSLQQQFPTLDVLAEQPVYLICRSGARSVLAAVSLAQMGFTNVHSITGGFIAWQTAGYEVSKPV